MNDGLDIIDRATLRTLRADLGAGTARIIAYFREDGAKSVAAIEEAMRRRDAAALVIPAHTLKGEALQLGAQPLGALAEQIEEAARQCVETQAAPDALVGDAVRLRPLFERTMTALTREIAAPAGVAAPAAAAARPVFGRRTFGTAVR